MTTTLDVRVDLDAHPWVHLTGVDYPLATVTHVGLLEMHGERLVALVVRTEDGRDVVATVSLHIARFAVEHLRDSRLARDPRQPWWRRWLA